MREDLSYFDVTNLRLTLYPSTLAIFCCVILPLISIIDFHSIVVILKFILKIVFDFLPQVVENVLNFLSTFGTNLQEIYHIFWCGVLFGQLLTLLVTHLPLTCVKIALIAHNNFLNVLFSFLLHLHNPFLQVDKRVFVVYCIHQHDACSTLVVCLCDVLISLLTGSVPNLKSDFLVVHLDRLDLEVDSNRRDVIVLEIFFCKFYDDVRFTDT